jgi:hypothetical protein
MKTITLTFGEQAENHAGMQIVGNGLDERGYSFQDLMEMKSLLGERGVASELIDLSMTGTDKAYLLVARDAVQKLSGVPQAALFDEQVALNWDTRAYMRGRVVNKRARYNLVYGETAQEPAYESKKGRIVAYEDLPLTRQLRAGLMGILDLSGLQCEGNYYYHNSMCGIGFHGDSERRKVMGVRLGAPMDLHYQWYVQSQPMGERVVVGLKGGDLYVMSEKCSGSDWKKRIVPTLRHATGASTFTYPARKDGKKGKVKKGRTKRMDRLLKAFKK